MWRARLGHRSALRAPFWPALALRLDATTKTERSVATLLRADRCTGGPTGKPALLRPLPARGFYQCSTGDSPLVHRGAASMQPFSGGSASTRTRQRHSGLRRATPRHAIAARPGTRGASPPRPPLLASFVGQPAEGAMWPWGVGATLTPSTNPTRETTFHRFVPLISLPRPGLSRARAGRGHLLSQNAHNATLFP